MTETTQDSLFVFTKVELADRAEIPLHKVARWAAQQGGHRYKFGAHRQSRVRFGLWRNTLRERGLLYLIGNTSKREDHQAVHR